MNKVHLIDNMEFMRNVPDKYYELAIVDPPYGIGADKNQETLSGNKGFTKGAGTYRKYHSTDWDSSIPNKIYFDELKRVATNYIIWGGNYFHCLNDSGVIIWYKKGSGNFKEGELAKTNINTFKVFTYSRADAYINDCDIKIHPTQKPVALYKWLLKNYAKPGDKIFDSHVGSGSIRIACHDMGFDFEGCEIDKDYWEAQENRYNGHAQQGSLFSDKEIQGSIYKEGVFI